MGRIPTMLYYSIIFESDYELSEDANQLVRKLRPLMADVKQDEVISAISEFLKET